MDLSSNISLEQLPIVTTFLAEYSTADFEKEVLRIAGQTEALFDEAIKQEAQALGISRPSTPTGTHHSICASATTTDSNYVRTGSTSSKQSECTTLFSTSDNEPQLEDPGPTHTGKQIGLTKSFSFSEYEQYLCQVDAPRKAAPPSLFSVSTRRQFNAFRSGLKSRFRLRRRKAPSQANSDPCICCQEDSKALKTLHNLPCQHQYCEKCLRVLVSQATVDESKMPPQCCTKAIPGTIIKGLLDQEEQDKFINSILQFSTPWEARIFCPDSACGVFLPKQGEIKSEHPSEVVCWKCQKRACSMCKQVAHAIGQDCPADSELDNVLQMGEKFGWRRCYNCRNLVELTQGCSHITCRCKAQFCYLCGAAWDSVIGCPSHCNVQEELDRKRQEENAQVVQLEAEKLAREEADKAEASERLAAEKRTEDSQQLSNLREQQIHERDRFCAFEQKMKWTMWDRQGDAKLQLRNKYGELKSKMLQRHIRMTNQLEDRQVCAEMELRSHFNNRTRIVKASLAHMEAYCDGLGRSENGGNPARTVTERDLRELGQQYNIRDNLERLHQSKINVMRDKQTKQMEELLLRHQEELEGLEAKQSAAIEALERSFDNEEEGFFTLFDDRKERMCKRWLLVERITRKKLELERGVVFAPLKTLEWPDLRRRDDGIFDDSGEEETGRED